MATQGKSRWADDEEDARISAERKKEKDAKKQAKIAKQRKAEAEELERDRPSGHGVVDSPRPTKRRRLSEDTSRKNDEALSGSLLRFPAPEWGPCRHVDNFEKLNHIEEGSYGWVSRAQEITSGEIVALKKLKMDYSTDGFPVTGLREIQTLMASRHANIVGLREVVMGDKLDE